MGRLGVHVHSYGRLDGTHAECDRAADLPTAPSDRHVKAQLHCVLVMLVSHEEGSKCNCGSRQRDLEAVVCRIRTTSKTIPSNAECDYVSTAQRTSGEALHGFEMQMQVRPEWDHDSERITRRYSHHRN